jgi:hypothetical protein
MWMMAACVAAAPALSGCAELGALGVFSEPQSEEDRLPGAASPREARELASDTLGIFSADQSAEDRLPEGATPHVIGGIDPDSTRLLWTSDGVSYFAALSEESGQCLVVLESGEAWSGCSALLPIQLESQGGPEMLFADKLPDTSEDWVKVADHLWTRPE